MVNKMKLMTINTHSLAEENYSEKLEEFISAAAELKPEVIALQEANQTAEAEEVPISELTGFTSCGAILIKKDNHIYNAVRRLRDSGVGYYWTWLGIKKGYDKFDEGIGLMSLSPILETKVIGVSEVNDYSNWKTRKIVGIRTQKQPEEWLFSVHYGWWSDECEPFQKQWERTLMSLPEGKNIWLMGDFNSPAEIRGESYDMMINSGFHDSFTLAKNRDNGITVSKTIDGWQGRKHNSDGMRIDLILASQPREILSSQVIFNGRNRAVISDHFGVMIEANYPQIM